MWLTFDLFMTARRGDPKASGLQSILIQVRCTARHVRRAMGIFCYTADNFAFIDSAASAVRNLNDYEIMNRKLRVDFSNDGGEDDNNVSEIAISRRIRRRQCAKDANLLFHSLRIQRTNLHHYLQTGCQYPLHPFQCLLRLPPYHLYL
jgi:hypothetical protein